MNESNANPSPLKQIEPSFLTGREFVARFSSNPGAATCVAVMLLSTLMALGLQGITYTDASLSAVLDLVDVHQECLSTQEWRVWVVPRVQGN